MGRPCRADHGAGRGEHRRQPRYCRGRQGKEGSVLRRRRRRRFATNKDCTPYTVHSAYNTTALGNGTAATIVKEGGKTWFFVTADYAFGTQLQDAAARVVTPNGGKVLGSVRAPLATPDFASYVLQAQNSGAQVLGFANAGPDFSNALKAANELGITKTMKPAALLAFVTDIRALGLETAQGLYLTTAWYWDLDGRSRAFAKRFLDKVGREPTFIQAATIPRRPRISPPSRPRARPIPTK